MGRIGTIKVENLFVSLKSVVLVVSKEKKEKQQLVEDITRMGCEGLLVEPWAQKKQGDGAGVFVGVLQQMGGHNPMESGTMDGRLLGGSLQLPEGRHRNGRKNR